MSTIAELNKEIEGHRVAIASLRQAKLAVFHGRTLACAHCKETAVLAHFGFIQDHQYEPPHGCTGGDTWYGRPTHCCYIICPSCVQAIYIYCDPSRVDVEEAVDKEGFSPRELFAVVWEKHGKEMKKIYQRAAPETTS